MTAFVNQNGESLAIRVKSMVVRRRQERLEKIKTLSVFGKWNMLVKETLRRYNINKEARILARWSQLILALDYQGHLNL